MRTKTVCDNGQKQFFESEIVRKFSIFPINVQCALNWILFPCCGLHFKSFSNCMNQRKTHSLNHSVRSAASRFHFEMLSSANSLAMITDIQNKQQRHETRRDETIVNRLTLNVSGLVIEIDSIAFTLKLWQSW